MIRREGHLAAVKGLLRSFPVVALLGARQAGKTTLARRIGRGHGEAVRFFDLEDPADLAQLTEPMLALRDLRGLVILDEIQRRPEIFPVLRVLADREESPARFLVLGSASPDLLRQSSESLAGRIAYHPIDGFSLDEVGTESLDPLWIRGGFPRSFLASTDEESARWRREFIRTYLERDIPQLGFRVPALTISRFWTMLAHYHGQIWNGAELARSLAVSDKTIRSYLDILVGTFMVDVVPPWFTNSAKRLVKAPRVYLRDSGILHALLNLWSSEDVQRHPRLGASWEGFAMHEILRRLGALPEERFFWATHGGAELDLLVVRGSKRLGFEIKRTDAPTTTRSMHVALADLELDGLDVVHAGDRTFPLAGKIRALSLSRLLQDLEPL